MWTAAEGADVSSALVTAVWAFLGIVVTTLGAIAMQAIKGRSERTAPSLPPPTDTALLVQLAREQGQLVQRVDDSDERDDMQDRTLHNYGDRLEALERYNDHRDPDWRRDG